MLYMDSVPPRRVFLSAEWSSLAMLNYRVDADLLRPYVPAGTELDFFQGQTFISLVGFRFPGGRACVGACLFPGHTDFDEVNLRFYVRREEAASLVRGVAFIREIVPRWAIAAIARRVYHEPYVCLPMRHAVELDSTGIQVQYEWRSEGRWNRLHARGSGTPVYPGDGSLDQFITEHYWGYTNWGYTAHGRGGVIQTRTAEYRVTHPPWRVWVAATAGFDGDGVELYGQGFAAILRGRPDSAFIAEGSPVTVSMGRRLAAQPAR